ncbi:MAG: Ig domain-containing protein [Bacteroidales bacterium]|nr:Ig domain-containing protein [Bacteroidales bacterium]
MAKKQGICKNLDGPCSLAVNKIIQEVDSTQFICEECGMELYEVQSNNKKKKTKKKGQGGLIVVAIAALLAISAACYFLIPRIGKPKTVSVSAVAVTPDSIELKEGTTAKLYATVLPEDAEYDALVWSSQDETIVTVDQTGEIKGIKAGKAMVYATAGDVANHCNVTVTAKPKPAPFSLSWGIYDGPMQNGVPHGVQGEVNVTASYRIDLKKAPAQYIYVKPGDKIVNCKFNNGRLVYGMLKRTNGEQVAINIGQ